MPWKETGPVHERLKFIAAWSESEDENFAAHCRAFGVSRRVGYKWLERYERGGPTALEDRTSKPRLPAHQLSAEVIDAVVTLRKEHASWGPKKLRAVLAERWPERPLPATSTVGDIIKRYGLVLPRKRRLRVPMDRQALGPAGAPNDVWGIDFKGQFALGDGSLVYPLTISDLSSRYLLMCEGLARPLETQVRVLVERAFRDFGLPRRIRSDNGVPFASTALGGLTALSVWWIKLEIELERIEPGHPEQNGRHERMHRTLKQEATQPAGKDLREQQRLFDRFRAEFNDTRPHEALGQVPPGRRHTMSLRSYPSVLRSPEYGADIQVRKADEKARILWHSQRLYLPRCLAHEPIGMAEVGDGVWSMQFGPVVLGMIRREGREYKVQAMR
jgi:putative transposase